MRPSHLSVLLALGFAGCGTRIVPPYTTAFNLMKVRPGMEVRQVRDTLEAPPYDILASHQAGHAVFVWYYQHPEYEVGNLTPVVDAGKGDGRLGLRELDKAYFAFENGQLAWFVTENGLHFEHPSAVTIFLEGALLDEAVTSPVSVMEREHAQPEARGGEKPTDGGGLFGIPTKK